MRKPLTGKIYSALILLSIIIGITACTKTPTAGNSATIPSVVTLNAISSLTATTAQSGGITTNDNNGDIVANGVVYSSTDQTPTIADSKTLDTINSLGFTSRLTGLTPGTKYYLRAYASNNAGPGYGAVVTFTTPAATSGTLTANVTTFSGSTSGALGYQDGSATSALFNGPQALTYNPVAGNLYVLDALNNLIRIVSTSTGAVSTLNNPTLGLVNGTLSGSEFYGPRSVAFDAAGNAYVADYGNNVIRKITTAGVVSTFAGNGTAGYSDGSTTIEFNGPQGVAVDPSGNVYVADKFNNCIRKITPAGVASTFAGYLNPNYVNLLVGGYLDGTGTAAAFSQPTAVACDASGNVYVADNGNRALRMITPAGVVTTLAGSPVQKNVVGAIVALCVDAAGDIFMADESGRVLDFTASKALYTVAGALNTTGFVNGSGTVALFNEPLGVAVDAAGNVYVSDFNNNVIRKITVKFQ